MKKFLSHLLAFCILTLQSGCMSVRTLSREEASIQETRKSYLILHTPKARYQLLNYKFTEKGVEGILDKYEGKSMKLLHVYTNLNLSLASSGKSLEQVLIPKTNIEKIKYPRFNGPATIIAVVATLGVAFLVTLSQAFGSNFNLSSP